MNAIRRIIRRPDFRRNPVKAAWRRIYWRFRWTLSKAPWNQSLGPGLTLTIPGTGTGAQIYYQGYSEPETAEFILSYLTPGMVALDVGAHFGEYTLLAAQAVGDRGRVHAFEPHPEIFGLLAENVRRNGLENVQLNRLALAEDSGVRDFQMHAEPAVSSLKPPPGGEQAHRSPLMRTIKVESTTLDQYCESIGTRVDLVKIDVEGSELFVLQGASRLLDQPPDEAPVWIFEYSRENCPRFGYQPDRLLAHLSDHGYEVLMLGAHGRLAPLRSRPSNPTVNLVAAKSLGTLASKARIEG